MITRQELLSNRELLADKTQGALSGLAIGDSFGDAARTPDNQRDYGFITDFHKGDSWSTDDTEFALMVAKPSSMPAVTSLPRTWSTPGWRM